MRKSTGVQTPTLNLTRIDAEFREPGYHRFAIVDTEWDKKLGEKQLLIEHRP